MSKPKMEPQPLIINPGIKPRDDSEVVDLEQIHPELEDIKDNNEEPNYFDQEIYSNRVINKVRELNGKLKKDKEQLEKYR